jgi:hypothetical protein
MKRMDLRIEGDRILVDPAKWEYVKSAAKHHSDVGARTRAVMTFLEFVGKDRNVSLVRPLPKLRTMSGAPNNPISRLISDLISEHSSDEAAFVGDVLIYGLVDSVVREALSGSADPTWRKPHQLI